MITGLQYISNLSTASLNRLYAEHMDLCSHRLDAWMLGLVNQRLVKQRKTKPSGIYLGSFGYLLDLKPNAAMSVVFKEEPAEYMPLAPANVGTAAIPIIHVDAAKQNGLVLSGNGWKNAFFYIGDDTAQPRASQYLHRTYRTGYLHQCFPDRWIYPCSLTGTCNCCGHSENGVS